MIIVDAHLDLAYNALTFGRNLLGSLDAVHQSEISQPIANGTAMVTFPSLLEASVDIVFATILVEGASKPILGNSQKLGFRNQEEAHDQAQSQLDYYRRLADEVDFLHLVSHPDDLEDIITNNEQGTNPQIGIVLLLEGAEPVRDPEEVELWYENGLRIIGLAHDDTRYSASSWRGSGGLTDEGRQLLEIMADFGFILDLSNMSEQWTLEALDQYEASVIASHSNCRALLPQERHLSDLQIRRIAERQGVIGVTLFNGYLKAGYGRGDPKESVTTEHIVAHIDHICQYVGDANHVGIGSDFDGGFGVEDAPDGIFKHSDLKLVAIALQGYGYDEEDIAKIMGGNWLSLLRSSLNP